MDSLGNPDTATFKSPKLSLFDGWDSELAAWLPEVLLYDGGGRIRTGLVFFCDLNHCIQLCNLSHYLFIIWQEYKLNTLIRYWLLVSSGTFHFPFRRSGSRVE